MRKLLDLMLADMEKSDERFRPTNFWQKGMVSILNDLQTEDDFAGFRNHISARKMYVPVYEHSIYQKRKKLIDKIFRVNYKNKPVPSQEGFFGTLSGYNQAKCDYRTFLATHINSYPEIKDVSESLIGNPVEYYCFNNKNYSRSFLNYLLGLNFLKQNVNTRDLKSVFEIGGGYGTLGEILIKASPDFFYLNIDIPPVAAVSSYYLTRLFGKDQVLTYDESRALESIDIEELRKKYKCIILCPWQLPKLKGSFDLFVNFMSFQEMEPHIVANYISFAEKHTTGYVLLRNSREGKKVADNETEVGVKKPTTNDDMYEMFKEFKLVNRDYQVFGQYSNSFISEIACLIRKK